MTDTDDTLPLAGIRVLDLTAIVLGPLATLCLADFGADVVKVEGPAGDGIRNSGAVTVAGMSSIYLALNRNKRSLALDLKKPGAQEVLHRLAEWADVVVHNLRPRSARDLGLDPETLRALNPRLVYCSASGFAEGSARAEEPAVDDVIQATSGMADLFARTGGSPRYAPAIMADKVCGLILCQAILAGLLRRERTGQGMSVNVPMAETMTAFNLVEHMGAATFGGSGETGYGRLMTPHRRPIATRDGYIAMTPYTKRDWQGFLRAAGYPDLAESARVTDPVLRNTEVGMLYAQLGEILKTRDTAEWIDIARAVGIPVAAVRSLDEALEDPAVRDLGFVVEYPHPEVGPIRGPGSLVKITGEPDAPPRPAPPLGRDTAAVLAGIGFSEAEIDGLLASGVALAG
ncbi:CaiB/BaiF CoA transferase family protein [Seohaeicola zhoushanensis]|uniref:CoA transferase n=1 Tax=Seohaeicola zhoushanensis TaxID=1569283 RepID=A0A8J3H207_9RHOB|nr:CoA transferase [Seohaeicola zhoushanensis]GHF67449.1 CoA transferase [Seohaeicola zhoushanensis]